jgi:hypothetical protein
VLSTPASIGCLDTERQIRAYMNLLWTFPLQPNKPLRTPRLPAFIPELLRGMPADCELPDDVLYAVSLSSLLDEYGRLRFNDPALLRRALRLPWNARLLLLGTGDDETLEAFWRRSEEDDYWTVIQRLRFSAATTFTFSIWGNDPRFDQQYNQRRNEATFEILNGLGIPTTPFFFCSAPEDYSRAARWLEKRPEIDTLAVLAQFYRKCNEVEHLLEDAQRLPALVGRSFRQIVVGVATREKIDCARAILEDPIIVTSQPIMKAVKGRQANELLEFTKVSDPPRGKLVGINLGHFQAYCN